MRADLDVPYVLVMKLHQQRTIFIDNKTLVLHLLWFTINIMAFPINKHF